jgi:hypothetical protein
MGFECCTVERSTAPETLWRQWFKGSRNAYWFEWRTFAKRPILDFFQLGIRFECQILKRTTRREAIRTNDLNRSRNRKRFQWWTDAGMYIDWRDEQYENTPELILRRLQGASNVTFRRPLQPHKQNEQRTSTWSGMEIEPSDEQSRNWRSSIRISCEFSWNVKALSPLHPSKQRLPRNSTDAGRQMDLSMPHRENKSDSIRVRLEFGSNTTVCREGQELKQFRLMISTEAGMRIERIRDVHDENAALWSFMIFDESENCNSREAVIWQSLSDIRQSDGQLLWAKVQFRMKFYLPKKIRWVNGMREGNSKI